MKNWRTTAIGAAGAFVTIAGNLLSQGNLRWQDYLNALIFVALGTYAKDAGISGTAR